MGKDVRENEGRCTKNVQLIFIARNAATGAVAVAGGREPHGLSSLRQYTYICTASTDMSMYMFTRT